MIRGVKLVSIPVADQDPALAFSTDVLGFRLLTDQPFNDKRRWLELGIPGAYTRVVLFQLSGVKLAALKDVAVIRDLKKAKEVTFSLRS
jgi:catechol 2,3-dioxygenase-like lactoylglutathione lyase family enzyme